MTSKKQRRSLTGTIGLALLLIFVGVFMALPLVYAIVSSIKPPEEFFLFPPRLLVKNPTLQNFKAMGSIISNMWVPFERYLFNSSLISIISTVIYLIIASLAAYALAMHEFPGKKLISATITLALLFTPSITAIPQYIVLSKLGLINSYAGIILPSLANTIGVFLCMQYLEVVPRAIIESGKMDGAGEYGIWWSLVLPNIKPVLFTMLIFQFQAVWNTTGGNILYNENLKTLPLALSQIATAGIARAGVGSAAALLLMIPPVLVFILSQANVMETMAHSGIKD